MYSLSLYAASERPSSSVGHRDVSGTHQGRRQPTPYNVSTYRVGPVSPDATADADVDAGHGSFHDVIDDVALWAAGLLPSTLRAPRTRCRSICLLQASARAQQQMQVASVRSEGRRSTQRLALCDDTSMTFANIHNRRNNYCRS